MKKVTSFLLTEGEAMNKFIEEASAKESLNLNVFNDKVVIVAETDKLLSDQIIAIETKLLTCLNNKNHYITVVQLTDKNLEELRATTVNPDQTESFNEVSNKLISQKNEAIAQIKVNTVSINAYQTLIDDLRLGRPTVVSLEEEDLIKPVAKEAAITIPVNESKDDK